jgi:hypothetical protein
VRGGTRLARPCKLTPVVANQGRVRGPRKATLDKGGVRVCFHPKDPTRNDTSNGGCGWTRSAPMKADKYGAARGRGDLGLSMRTSRLQLNDQVIMLLAQHRVLWEYSAATRSCTSLHIRKQLGLCAASSRHEPAFMTGASAAIVPLSAESTALSTTCSQQQDAQGHSNARATSSYQNVGPSGSSYGP